MKTHSINLSKWLGALAVGAVLSLGVLYTSNLNAAQGCGYGYHMTYYGRCIPNYPGPYSVFVPGNSNCWYNLHGFIRCFRVF